MAINISLSKLPWYSQIGVFAALGVAAAAVFWNWYAQPARADNEKRRSKLMGIRADIDRGQRTARELPQFRQRVAALEGQLAELSRQLPEEQDVADLLRRVQGMATQSNLTILGFTPQNISKKTMYVEWPIGLRLEGSYHDLGLFLERVSKFPRIINVSNLKVKGIDRNCACAATSTITAELTATTFVLVEQAKPGAATAPGAKPGTPAAAAAPATKQTE
jgi:type IV pilus assembly protein PilO